MNLTIDIGNTVSKAALFDDNVLIQLENPLTTEKLLFLLENNRVQHVIFSSVSDQSTHSGWLEMIHGSGIVAVFHLTHTLPVPIANEYQSPQTLGMDRLASIVGGTTLFPNQDLLVIDAGTCITFDFLQNNTYKGGAISPGIQIKLKALHTFTHKLPLVDLEPSASLIGQDTKASILSGVLNGTISEINYTIEEYKGISDNLAVILCGGDAKLLSKTVKNIDCVAQELVFIGLNEILNYNVKKL